MSDQGAVIAEVLREHQPYRPDGDLRHAVCDADGGECGWTGAFTDHPAHVAAVVLAALNLTESAVVVPAPETQEAS